MKIHTKAVHSGDRKKPGPCIPVTTPVYTASSYFYESMEQLDRIARGAPGWTTLLKLEQCGHSPQRDQPEAVIAAIGALFEQVSAN